MNKAQIKFAMETLAGVFTPDGREVEINEIISWNRFVADHLVDTSGGTFWGAELRPSAGMTRLVGWPGETLADRLTAAGWFKVRASSECGEALVASGTSLNGLACKKSATWHKEGQERRCAQHALRA